MSTWETGPYVTSQTKQAQSFACTLKENNPCLTYDPIFAALNDVHNSHALVFNIIYMSPRATETLLRGVEGEEKGYLIKPYHCRNHKKGKTKNIAFYLV